MDKIFNIKTSLKGKETLSQESQKGDSFVNDEKNKKVVIKLKGDYYSKFSNIRFDNLAINQDKKEVVKVKAKSYGVILDNGVTVIVFNY